MYSISCRNCGPGGKKTIAVRPSWVVISSAYDPGTIEVKEGEGKKISWSGRVLNTPS
jgi:hypothetical protein